LLHGLGRPGAVGAVTLLAYLVGSVEVAVVRETSRVAVAAAVKARFQDGIGDWPKLKVWRPITNNAHGRLEHLVRKLVLEQSSPQPGFESGDVNSILGRVVHDVVYGGAKRLVVARPELFAEYDRVQSEAELRDALVVPLALLGVVLAFNIQLSPIGLAVSGLGLGALACVLWIQARLLDRDAWSINVHAIADEAVSTHTLDLLRGS